MRLECAQLRDARRRRSRSRARRAGRATRRREAPGAALPAEHSWPGGPPTEAAHIQDANLHARREQPLRCHCGKPRQPRPARHGRRRRVLGVVRRLRVGLRGGPEGPEGDEGECSQPLGSVAKPAARTLLAAPQPRPSPRPGEAARRASALPSVAVRRALCPASRARQRRAAQRPPAAGCVRCGARSRPALALRAQGWALGGAWSRGRVRGPCEEASQQRGAVEGRSRCLHARACGLRGQASPAAAAAV